MVFNTLVRFMSASGPPIFNPKTGNMEEKSGLLATRLCHVEDLSTEQKVRVYGQVDQAAKRVIHPGKVLAAEYAKLDGLSYRILDRRQLRGKASYWLGGVMR